MAPPIVGSPDSRVSSAPSVARIDRVKEDLPFSIWPPVVHEPGLLDLQSSLRLAYNGAFSDLTIRCGDKELRVHKVIVCHRSTVLAHVCAALEAIGHGDVVDINCDSPASIQAMIEYLYFGYYPVASPEVDHPIGRSGQADAFFHLALLDAQVYEAAERFAIDDLKHKAVANFIHKAQAHPDFTFSPYFASAIDRIYRRTMDNHRIFREAICEIVMRNFSCINTKYIRYALRSTPGLEYDLDLAIKRHLGNLAGENLAGEGMAGAGFAGEEIEEGELKE